MYDDYDYDYEPEPYSSEIVFRTYELGVETYEVEIQVDTWEIRKGNYSPIASDPDEYFGEYKTTYFIRDVIYYSEPESEGIYIDESELPKEIDRDIQYEFEE